MRDPIPAFRYVDGQLVPVDGGGRMSFYVAPMPPAAFGPLAPPSKRARRRWARQGTRNRVGARRIPPVAHVSYRAPEPTRLDAHHFADGHREAVIYLPQGEAPTGRHVRDLEVAVCRVREADPPRRARSEWDAHCANLANEVDIDTSLYRAWMGRR